jgi:hypothetical protein
MDAQRRAARVAHLKGLFTHTAAKIASVLTAYRDNQPRIVAPDVVGTTSHLCRNQQPDMRTTGALVVPNIATALHWKHRVRDGYMELAGEK